jgi:pyruvate ferredoxin oxidoreductase beta subunit
MFRKFKKARQITGMKFIHLLSACPPGWRIDPANSIQVMRMATQSNVFPIYEVTKLRFSKDNQRFEEDWKYTINVFPERKVSVKGYLKSQGRFGLITDEMIDYTQKKVDRKWNELVQKQDKTNQVIQRQAGITSISTPSLLS